MSKSDHILVISPDGTVHALYTDLIDLRAFGGEIEINRASHVEWDATLGGWTVEFPDGRYLCADRERGMVAARDDDQSVYLLVWQSRQDALNAEIEYLQARL